MLRSDIISVVLKSGKENFEQFEVFQLSCCRTAEFNMMNTASYFSDYLRF